MNTQQLLEDFEWFCSSEKRLSQNTVSSYLFDLKAWVREGLNLESQQAPKVDEIREMLERFEKSEKIKASSLARRQSSLRAFARFRSFQAPHWEELLRVLIPGKVSEPWPAALSVADIEKLLDFEAPLFEAQLVRNRALLELMYATGLRVSEALALEWNQVDERSQTLRVLGKGQKERMVPFTDRAWLHLSRYRESAWVTWSEGLPKEKAAVVFMSHLKKPLTRMAVWKILHKRSLVCGLEGVHPHVLRHSFATHLLQGGADVRFVQLLLGHSSLNTTERYLKLADDELKELFAKHHPLN